LTIQRNWQHWVHKTQDEEKQNKNTTQYVWFLWKGLLVTANNSTNINKMKNQHVLWTGVNCRTQHNMCESKGTTRLHTCMLIANYILYFIIPCKFNFSRNLQKRSCKRVVPLLSHILCCVFILFLFVLCLVYPMLPVSLDCQFFIVPSVDMDVNEHRDFSNIKLRHKLNKR
jgi:hypothetical protein